MPSFAIFALPHEYREEFYALPGELIGQLLILRQHYTINRFIMFSGLFKKDKQKDFWDWFVKNEQAYFSFEDDRDQLFNELAGELRKIHPDIVFAFSATLVEGKRDFVISADGIQAAFPYVIDLVAKAPVLENWTIYAFRQRRPGDNLEIRFDDTSGIGYSDIFFRYNEEDKKIGLELHIRGNDDDNDSYKNVTFILLDALLGEYDVETKISWIEFTSLDEEEIENLYPLIYLRKLVDDLSDGIPFSAN